MPLSIAHVPLDRPTWRSNASQRDVLTLDEQVCFAMVVATRSILGVYRPLEPLGLTHPQYLVMLALWQHHPVTLKRLSELLSLEPPRLSPLLKRLENAGPVERRRSTQNERQLAVTLTPAGLTLRERALEVPPAIVTELGIATAACWSTCSPAPRSSGSGCSPHRCG